MHHSTDDSKDTIPPLSELSSNERTAVPCALDSLATIGTYLLTNVLAQSAILGLGGPMAHQSALAMLAACAHLQSKSHYSTVPSTITTPVQDEITLQKTSLPFRCGIDMSHSSTLPSNSLHGVSTLTTRR